MTEPTVFIIDDSAAIRDSLFLLLETAGLPAEAYASAEDFLAALRPDAIGCVVLDVNLPGMHGPELQAELARRGIGLPTIFLTAHGDIPTTVRAMKAGAIDFLTKPVEGAVLLERIGSALERAVKEREAQAARQAANARLAALTERERQILQLAAAGHTNKAIAQQLGISFRTVEVHRAHILQKTGAASLLELARLLGTSGFGDEPR